MDRIRAFLLNFVLEKILFRGGKMKILDGYKSLIGLVGLAICLCLYAFGIPVPEWILVAFGSYLGYGVLDKFNKLKSAVEDIKKEFSNIPKK